MHRPYHCPPGESMGIIETNHFWNMDRQQYERMTAAEVLEYYKNDVFAKMGIEIEGLQNRDAEYQKYAKVSVADQMLGMDAHCDFAREHAFCFFDDDLNPIKENPLMQAPQEGLAGWLVELMRLLAYLLVNDPFLHPFDLNWLDNRFQPMGKDGAKQFSPSNHELIHFLTANIHVGVLVAKMIKEEACNEVAAIDSALVDFYVFSCRRENVDFTDYFSCYEYIENLRNAIQDVEMHMKRGQELGLTIEEIGLVDSLWTEIPHFYQENYVAAAREIWQKVKATIDNLGDGQKSEEDEDHFVEDMVAFSLSIAEKYDVDMEQDDVHSLPMGYLENWLMAIYEGDNATYGI